MKLQLNNHLKELLGNKVCAVHNERIKFVDEKQSGDRITSSLSFCCEDFKKIIEGENKAIEEAALNAAKDAINEEIKNWFKK